MVASLVSSAEMSTAAISGPTPWEVLKVAVMMSCVVLTLGNPNLAGFSLHTASLKTLPAPLIARKKYWTSAMKRLALPVRLMKRSLAKKETLVNTRHESCQRKSIAKIPWHV